MPGSFEEGAGFRVCGQVVRKYVNDPNGNFATLVLDVNASPKSLKVEMRAFHRGSVDDIRNLQPGQRVKCTGKIDWEPIKNRARADVIIDGYSKWVAVLSILTVEVEGSSRLAAPPADGKSAPPPAKKKANLDEDPGFGDGGFGNSTAGKPFPGDDDIPF